MNVANIIITAGIGFLTYLAIRQATQSVSQASKSISTSAQNITEQVAKVNQNVSDYFHKWDSGVNISAGDQGGIDVTPIPQPEQLPPAFAPGLSQLAYDPTIVEGT